MIVLMSIKKNPTWQKSMWGRGERGWAVKHVNF